MAAGRIVFERHRCGNRLLRLQSPTLRSLNDPCTNAHPEPIFAAPSSSPAAYSSIPPFPRRVMSIGGTTARTESGLGPFERRPRRHSRHGSRPIVPLSLRRWARGWRGRPKRWGYPSWFWCLHQRRKACEWPSTIRQSALRDCQNRLPHRRRLGPGRIRFAGSARSITGSASLPIWQEVWIAWVQAGWLLAKRSLLCLVFFSSMFREQASAGRTSCRAQD